MDNLMDILSDPEKIMKQVNHINDVALNITSSGQAGGNMVKVTINGRFEVLDIKIDPICVDKRDVKMLEDLVTDAFNDAVSKAFVNISDIPMMSFDKKDDNK